MIKLLALDVDGTLIGADFTVSPRTRAAIAAAQAQGVGVSLVTGRNWATTRPYVQELGLNAPQVVFNGAVVALDGNGKTLYARALEWAIVEALIAIARRHELFLELHTMEHCFIERVGPESAFQQTKLGDDQVLTNFDALDRSARILKAQFVLPSESQRPLLAHATEALSGTAVLSWGVSTGFPGWFANVMLPGEDKDTGLKVALAHLGLGWGDVLAVGDSPSDLTFVSKAGLGFVMGNAPEDVRLQAPNVAPSVQNDGLAQVIEEHVLRG
ncbi:MAG: HAD family phosphatase [Chloroflexi bacterium]|nr:HAD family phosphatase [Chloroflexota bacterium]